MKSETQIVVNTSSPHTCAERRTIDHIPPGISPSAAHLFQPAVVLAPGALSYLSARAYSSPPRASFVRREVREVREAEPKAELTIEEIDRRIEEARRVIAANNARRAWP